MSAFWEELERRLREEIERKVTIVQQSPARPTVAQVQQRIQEFGDKCYEFEDRLTQAKLDYIELKGNRWEMTYTVKESINYMLKLKDMRAKHLDEMRELSNCMDQFYLAHEWYEILVAVGDSQEIDRLMYLDSLAQHVTMRPTRPTDRGYPLPEAIFHSYLKNDVGRVVQNYQREYGTLTHDEKEELHDVEEETTRSRAAEMRAYQEIQQSLTAFTEEWRRQRESRQGDVTEANGRDMRRLEDEISQLKREVCQQHDHTRKWIEEAYNQAAKQMLIERKECTKDMKAELDSQLKQLQQKIACLEQQLLGLGVQSKEETERRGRENSEFFNQLTDEISRKGPGQRRDVSLEERRREHRRSQSREEISPEERRREPRRSHYREEVSAEDRRRERRRSQSTVGSRTRKESFNERREHYQAEGRKRKHSERETADRRKHYEELLANYEEELERTRTELRQISCPTRRIGDGGLKTGQNIMCILCKEFGQHYSDGCPRVISITDRVAILDNEGRCHRCLERHLNACPRQTSCFYCKNVGRSTAYDHHAGICPLPDEMARLRSRQKELEESVRNYQRELQMITHDGNLTVHSEDYPGPSHS